MTGQDLLVPDAAPRIRVHDRSTSSAMVLLAVADDVPRNALGHRHQLTADDQHAVVEAGEKVLHHDAAGVLACGRTNAVRTSAPRSFRFKLTRRARGSRRAV